MSPDLLHLYAIGILTLIGLGIFIAFIFASGLFLLAVADGLILLFGGLIRLYNWIAQKHAEKTV
ncbi:hypothetical protein QFZ60_001572 [Arthrobacter sp. B2I5]|uniref:hypothetical protein n=1 Tax=Arthrobacter sp. B2I5 TaxID=3042266 RepID=UPI0027827DED|nr:hypothetical protein [Arthrobacter sp. B2I5]MDQ0825399.1 hypothetical protein [Arthrobacter sp. B2I5]